MRLRYISKPGVIFAWTILELEFECEKWHFQHIPYNKIFLIQDLGIFRIHIFELMNYLLNFTSIRVTDSCYSILIAFIYKISFRFLHPGKKEEKRPQAKRLFDDNCNTVDIDKAAGLCSGSFGETKTFQNKSRNDDFGLPTDLPCDLDTDVLSSQNMLEFCSGKFTGFKSTTPFSKMGFKATSAVDNIPKNLPCDTDTDQSQDMLDLFSGKFTDVKSAAPHQKTESETLNLGSSAKDHDFPQNLPCDKDSNYSGSQDMLQFCSGSFASKISSKVSLESQKEKYGVGAFKVPSNVLHDKDNTSQDLFNNFINKKSNDSSDEKNTRKKPKGSIFSFFDKSQKEGLDDVVDLCSGKFSSPASKNNKSFEEEKAKEGLLKLFGNTVDKTVQNNGGETEKGDMKSEYDITLLLLSGLYRENHRKVKKLHYNIPRACLLNRSPVPAMDLKSNRSGL